MSTEHDDGVRPGGSPTPPVDGPVSDGPAAPPAYDGAGKRRGERRRPWVRRHWIVSSLLAVTLLVVGGAGAYAYNLMHKFDNIDRGDFSVAEDADLAEDTTGAENILLLGEDNEGGTHRSDTIIVMHVPADRSGAYLVSIPRDSYVPIYDRDNVQHGEDKINAAYSLYGPAGTLATVQQLTGIQLDHVAIMDWEGFKDLSTALGGVEVYIPETFYDDSQKITWEAGEQTLEGERALQYVRTRHGLTNGDFDRIARQQNFLRSMMGKLISNGTVTNPFRLNSALEAITQNLTIDDQWSSGDLRDLALSLRSISTDDVEFVTAPLGSYDYTDEGSSIVRLDEKKSRHLFRALKNDNLDHYVGNNPDDALPGAREVS